MQYKTSLTAACFVMAFRTWTWNRLWLCHAIPWLTGDLARSSAKAKDLEAVLLKLYKSEHLHLRQLSCDFEVRRETGKRPPPNL